MPAYTILLGLLVGWLMARLFVRIVRQEKACREADVAARLAHYQQQAELAASRRKPSWSARSRAD